MDPRKRMGWQLDAREIEAKPNAAGRAGVGWESHCDHGAYTLVHRAVDWRRWAPPWPGAGEPKRLVGHPDVARDRSAFLARCNARERERQLGTGYGFGIFVDGNLAGEINLNSVQRGSCMPWVGAARFPGPSLVRSIQFDVHRVTTFYLLEPWPCWAP